MANKKEKTIVSQFTEIEKILREAEHTELADFMLDRIAKQTAKNSTKGGESKTAEANKKLAEVLYEAMEEEVCYTATQIGNMGIEGIGSASKATAVLKILVEDGRVTNAKVKGVSTYKVA
jgi:hypothetical protein